MLKKVKSKLKKIFKGKKTQKIRIKKEDKLALKAFKRGFKSIQRVHGSSVGVVVSYQDVATGETVRNETLTGTTSIRAFIRRAERNEIVLRLF